MIVYRFKTTFEDDDNFLREIELRADQTFEDFHQALLGNLGLDPGMLASFFICDQQFRKQTEIKLAENDHQTDEPENQVSEDKEVSEPEEAQHEKAGDEGHALQKRAYFMDACVLKDFIDDPHQRMLFVYDYVNQWTFYIELLKILPGNNETVYPHFHRVRGPKPRELKATPRQIPGAETGTDFGYEDEGLAGPENLSGLDQIEGGDDDIDNNSDITDEFRDDQ
ncbi:MAG: hypothetical protein R6U62_03695 [Bacteroidales bacterium]